MTYRRRLAAAYLSIVALASGPGCIPLAHPPETYLPAWCDQHPEDCRRCRPGDVWVAGKGCAARTPEPTPTPCPGRPGGIACPEGEEPWSWPGSHSASGCGCRPIESPAPSATPTQAPATATPTHAPTVVEPTPTPGPTNTPVVTPTATLTPVPVPPPSVLCATYGWRDWVDPEDGSPHREYVATSVPTGLPSGPVSLAVRGSRCPPGRERLEQFGVEGLARAQGLLDDGEIMCVAITACRYDQDGAGEHPSCKDRGKRAAWGLGYLVSQGHAQLRRVGDALVTHDIGRGCIDGWARYLPDPCDAVYAHPVYLDAAWTWGGYKLTDCATTPTPAPTARPTVGPTPGATPTPFYPPIQPSDFRLNFVNGCNHLRYPRLVNNDQDVRGQCDTTPRYIGTLKSGERWGNACDPDHYRCATEACPDVSDDERQQHRKTHELCAGREWLTTAGTRMEAPGVLVEQDDENPYQHWLTAPRGAEIEVRACLAVVPLVTTDGLMVASGDGCGAWKPVKFEVH